MDYLGSIEALAEPPGVDLDRWRQVIETHPNLKPVAPQPGINPFTRAPWTYHPHPGTARVVVDGKDVGMMSWAEDGTNRVAVWGEPGIVDQLAHEISMRLDGTYKPTPR